MNYIVFDLEWNQAAYKIDEEEDIPFEIIEIGAVKLDQDARKIDEFHRLIRPQVYPFLLRRTKELTGWTDKDLDTKGIYFEDACAEFLEWCGPSYIFCTWGPSDVTQLEKNMAYFKLKIPWKYPHRFLDVQKLYALEKGEGKQRRTLEFAAETMQLPQDGVFHHAIDDAKYTAMIFALLDRERFESYYSIDYFRIPKNRFEEKTFRFRTYSKFVSRSCPLREEVAKGRRIREMNCFICGKKLNRIIPWFNENGRSYVALGECPEHGKQRARIRIRTTEDSLAFFGVRTVKACSEEEELSIREKRDKLSEKRKEHRKRTAKNHREKLKQARLAKKKAEESGEAKE